MRTYMQSSHSLYIFHPVIQPPPQGIYASSQLISRTEFSHARRERVQRESTRNKHAERNGKDIQYRGKTRINNIGTEYKKEQLRKRIHPYKHLHQSYTLTWFFFLTLQQCNHDVTFTRTIFTGHSHVTMSYHHHFTGQGKKKKFRKFSPTQHAHGIMGAVGVVGFVVGRWYGGVWLVVCVGVNNTIINTQEAGMGDMCFHFLLWLR